MEGIGQLTKPVQSDSCLQYCRLLSEQLQSFSISESRSQGETLSDRQVSGQGGRNDLKATEKKVLQPILYDQTKLVSSVPQIIVGPVAGPTIILVLPEELLLGYQQHCQIQSRFCARRSRAPYSAVILYCEWFWGTCFICLSGELIIWIL